jgi:hypothetical protein
MPPSSVRDAPFYLRSPPRDVRVLNWGLRDDPWRTAPLMVFALAAAASAGVVSQNLAAAAWAGLAMAVALWRAWLPIAYEFGPHGVTQIVARRRRVISWLAIGDYEFTPRGVVLFPPGEATWWNAARGLFVLWAGRRQEIADVVEYYLGGRLLLEEENRSNSQRDLVPERIDPQNS